MAARTAEAVWPELRPHVEWAGGFALVLLYAGHPEPVGLLRQRLDDNLHLSTQRLRDLTPASVAEVDSLAWRLLAAQPLHQTGPVWVELWRHADDADWRRARHGLLHRLNERRFLLERDLRQPLVLVLPPEERERFYQDAPDLWTVRVFTAELAAPTPQSQRGELTPVPAEGRLGWGQSKRSIFDLQRPQMRWRDDLKRASPSTHRH